MVTPRQENGKFDSPDSGSSDADQTLSPHETCGVIKCSRRTLYNLTYPRGPIPAIRLSARLIRYRVIDVNAFLAQQVEGAVTK
jgi:predicted DNA-binding transcriptional regulator AlpA